MNAEIGVPLPARLGELLEILHPAGTVGDVAAVVGVCGVVALGLVALEQGLLAEPVGRQRDALDIVQGTKERMSRLGDDVKRNMGDDLVRHVPRAGRLHGDVPGGDGCVLPVDLAVGIGVSDDLHPDVRGVGVWADAVLDSATTGQLTYGLVAERVGGAGGSGPLATMDPGCRFDGSDLSPPNLGDGVDETGNRGGGADQAVLGCVVLEPGCQRGIVRHGDPGGVLRDVSGGEGLEEIAGLVAIDDNVCAAQLGFRISRGDRGESEAGH